MRLASFSAIWRIALFWVTLAINFQIVYIFYQEQNRSLAEVGIQQLRRVLGEMHDEATKGRGVRGGMGRDVEGIRGTLADLKKADYPADVLSQRLHELLVLMRSTGAEADLLNRFSGEIERGDQIRVITTWGNNLSTVIYLLIFGLAVYTFFFVLLFAERGRKSRLEGIIGAFRSSLASVSLTPGVDPVTYYRTRVEELNAESIGKENAYILHLNALGLLGTLFGLTLAFYVAASAFPRDLSSVFGSNESQQVVVGGLVQTIYNYAFAVITSLVAYSQSMTLRLLRGARKSNVLAEFDKHVQDALSRVDVRTGATERAIVAYIQEIVARSDIEERLKFVLADVAIYVDAAKKIVEDDIKKFRESIAAASKELSEAVEKGKKAMEETTDATAGMSVRITAYEILLGQLKHSSEILGGKLDRVNKELGK